VLGTLPDDDTRPTSCYVSYPLLDPFNTRQCHATNVDVRHALHSYPTSRTINVTTAMELTACCLYFHDAFEVCRMDGQTTATTSQPYLISSCLASRIVSRAIIERSHVWRTSPHFESASTHPYTVSMAGTDARDFTFIELVVDETRKVSCRPPTQITLDSGFQREKTANPPRLHTHCVCAQCAQL
jgi:hypothetical protein